MAVTPFDSALYRELFCDAEIGKLFSDSAEIRAMLLVEGALARAQGALGMIPAESGAFIHRASLEVVVDAAALAAETGRSAVVVPALVAAFRKLMNAPEHAQFVHWGATSQDIIDTALMLRLRRVLAQFDARLVALIRTLGGLAASHARLPMTARTWGRGAPVGRVATVTSFGAVVAAWGAPLLSHRVRLLELRPRLLRVSLAGTAGTLGAMGDQGPVLRRDLARALGLENSDYSWHSPRDVLAELAGWISLLAGTLGKMGEDIGLLAQSGIDEVALAAGGTSSAMPQKSNPVLPALLVALARHIAALNGAMQGAQLHRQQRDGAAWMAEWLSLPQICMSGARALSAAAELAGAITPNKAAMGAHIDDSSGLIDAEALVFALARQMPRPAAQAAVKALCQEVKSPGATLGDLAAARWPDVDFGALFTPLGQLGQAPTEAENFARVAKTI